MTRSLVTLLMISLCAVCAAQNKMQRCRGTYPYTYSENVSHAEAKAKAVENAIVLALADQFGTIVTSQAMLDLGGEKDRFRQMSRLQVKGKLVRHITEPQVSEPVFADNLFTVKVAVDFYAKAFRSAPTEFVVKVLRNGLDDRFEADHFVAGDDIYMSFRSPQDGYVAVFYQAMDKVSCMLPYYGEDDQPFAVQKGKRYILFDKDNNSYSISCHSEAEINYVYTIFSPMPFIDGDIIREMSSSEFAEWLGRKQSFDEKLQVDTKIIRVEPE